LVASPLLLISFLCTAAYKKVKRRLIFRERKLSLASPRANEGDLAFLPFYRIF
jgi:hypothetical protein